VTQRELYNRTPGVITVYGDLLCPFASLAIAGLRAARDRLGRDVRLDIRAFPLELINKAPHSYGRLEAEKAMLVGIAPGLGWRRWHAAPSKWPVTSLLPLEAVQTAKRASIGGLAASEELDSALRRAFFVDSRCIALLPVVLEVAEECAQVDSYQLWVALKEGAGRAEVFAQLGEQERGAVRASPHVFTAEGRDWLNPGLEMDHPGDYPVFKRYDAGVYEEIVSAA
jgi:predicted DsbA family dithiol-disulfide isomerase